MKTGSKLAILLLSLVAFAHLWRIVFAIPVTVGDTAISNWISVIGVLVPGLIAVQLWKEAR